jgi:hypothetical protein
VIREMHWCLWGSPYLDAYGEEDQDLRRGRPLYLNRYHLCLRADFERALAAGCRLGGGILHAIRRLHASLSMAYKE